MPTIDTNNPNRTLRKKEENKKRITTVAMELFNKQGVEKTTMEQIAEEADVAKGTLYNYFPVKEAIIDEYVKENFMMKYKDRWQRIEKLQDTQARFEQFLRELVEEVCAQDEIFEKHIVYMIKKITSLKREERVNSGFRLMAREILELGQKNREIRNDVPLEIMIGFLESSFINVVQQYFRSPESFNCDEAVKQYIAICVNGTSEQGGSFSRGKD